MPGLSYDGCCKVNRCSVGKLIFPYEWLDDYERLSHVGPLSHEAFYSKLKGNITCDEYDEYVQGTSMIKDAAQWWIGLGYTTKPT